MLQFDKEVIAWMCNGLQKNYLNTAKKKKKKLKNLDLTSKKQKNIKESDDSLFRNYWNKAKYIWLNNREI